MAPLFAKFVHRFRRFQSRPEQGFTLLELLVAILIGGIITSSLLFLVIEMMTVNNREESLTQTQQNMKRAIDFITRDVSEAVFVYSNFTQDPDASNPNFYNLIAELDDEPAGTPVLAFWRLDPLTDDEIDVLSGCTTTDCRRLLTRQSYYTLVVYFHQDNADGDIWEGPSRIIRYELPNFQGIDSTNLADETTPGYADPTLTLPSNNSEFNSFGSWEKSGTTVGTKQVLTDFVNLRDTNTSTACPGADEVRIPAQADSFYVCISQPDGVANSQDVNKSLIVYLQGNASKGTADQIVGLSESSSLPTLESEVLIRGVIQNDPDSD